MRKQIEKIVKDNYHVGDAKEAANKIVDLFCEEKLLKGLVEPKDFNKWSTEKRLGYYLALKHVKQIITLK